LIGQTVSHYKITGLLGEGGMGAVYRAEDTKLQRSVALKLLPADLVADPRARKSLLQEARVASRLNHPNIATIYEVGDEDEAPFTAMELVEGESLKDVVARGPIAADRMLDVARQIAEGLVEAHGEKVLHRDIKPGNVMVDGRGRVKVLDFGLAVLSGRERPPNEPAHSFVSRSSSRWSTGGTVPYMPPEQLRGETTDARGDVFSFGATLYECLSGTQPFPGETAVDVMHAILHSEPKPLRTHRPELPAAWGDLVGRCLQKQSAQRFASMEEVLEALKALGSAVPAPAAASEAKAEKSVAVLYFENLSRSAEDEYFRDGITEDVITELSKISGLGVYPRSAVLAYRDRPVTAPQVGRELGARFVLTGSVRRAGNRLRITTQLVTAANGQSVWAERFDRTMEDVFAIQDEIAQSIARALRVVLTEKEKKAIEKKQTADVQAYDYYLQGRQFFHQFRRKGFDFARQMFARAIVIDPNYARAYAGVAYCCSQLYAFWEAREANLKEADAASRKALELDPDLAEAHVARGLAISLSRRFEEAGREFATAIQQDPMLFEAYYFYARACLAQGNLEEAAQLFQKASDVRPEDYQAPTLLGDAYKGLGRKADADAAFHRALDTAERHLELHPDDARALYLGGGALAEIGQRARSLDWAKRALALDPNEPLTLYNVACLYATLGEMEQGIECLERSVKDGYSHRDWIQHDSSLNPLRGHPRFQKLPASL
jgi:non-specific serine/threonine protein kinase